MSARRRPPAFYVALAVALALGGALAWADAGAGDWDEERVRLLTRGVGWCAAALLLSSLFMTPLSRFTALRSPARFRRPLGVAAAGIAIVHVALASFGPLYGAWEAIWTWPHLRAGVGAIAILSALMTTSFPRVTRALGVRLWKPLHRLAYVAGGLVGLHIFLGPFAPRRAVAGFLVLFLAALAARLLPRSRPRRARSTPPSG